MMSVITVTLFLLGVLIGKLGQPEPKPIKVQAVIPHQCPTLSREYQEAAFAYWNAGYKAGKSEAEKAKCIGSNDQKSGE